MEIKDDESSSNKDVDIGNADKYFFTVRRYKDKATREEHFSIKVYEVITNDVCAEIEKTNIIELESKLLNLRVYPLKEKKHSWSSFINLGIILAIVLILILLLSVIL